MGSKTSYSGIKVFTATTAQKRNALGDMVTDWLARNPGLEPVKADVIQSSDDAHHCLSIVVYFAEKQTAVAA